MSIITAVKVKNQKMVNKVTSWLVKHNEYNDKRDFISDNLECEEDESKEWRQINKKCEVSFDKHLNYLEDLPKIEQNNIEKIANLTYNN